jgi:hypothetical protein
MALVLSKDFPGASPDSVDGETIAELMRTALWNAQAAGRPCSALVVANESAARIERRHGRARRERAASSSRTPTRSA